jgi:hypothetical protein
MTAEQKQCDEETGHDFLWHAPEHDVGFAGYGQCRTCGWEVAYEEADYDDNYM